MTTTESPPLLSLSAALDHMAALTGGPPPHRNTVYNWIKHGVRGVKLETRRLGGRIYLERDAIDRFMTGLSSGRPVVGYSERRRREIAAAGERARVLLGMGRKR